MHESPNGTEIVPEFITDSTGTVWSIIVTPEWGGQVYHDDKIDQNTRRVILLAYVNHVVYLQNIWAWYLWDKGWKLTTAPLDVASAVITVLDYASIQIGNGAVGAQ